MRRTPWWRARCSARTDSRCRALLVTLAVKDAPKKAKKLQSVSDGRGEFAFRVPPGAATYVVRTSLKGFQSVEKEASVSGEERVEVTLVLPAESK